MLKKVLTMTLSGLFVLSNTTFADSNWVALYSVPVTDSSLSAFATYIFQKDDSVPASEFVLQPDHIEFSLPAELVGTEKHFAMNLQSDSTWAGPGLKGTCTNLVNKVACDVHFDSFPIDMNQVSTAIKSESPDTTTLNGRLAVAAIFGGELHGTITIRVPE